MTINTHFYSQVCFAFVDLHEIIGICRCVNEEQGFSYIPACILLCHCLGNANWQLTVIKRNAEAGEFTVFVETCVGNFAIEVECLPFLTVRFRRPLCWMGSVEGSCQICEQFFIFDCFSRKGCCVKCYYKQRS